MEQITDGKTQESATHNQHRNINNSRVPEQVPRVEQGEATHVGAEAMWVPISSSAGRSRTALPVVFDVPFG